MSPCARESGRTPFSPSPSCLGISLQRKLLIVLPFIVQGSPGSGLTGSPCLYCCRSPSDCRDHPVTSPVPAAWLLFPLLLVFASLCRLPVLCLSMFNMSLTLCLSVPAPHSHSPPPSHILSVWVILFQCLFSISLFI